MLPDLQKIIVKLVETKPGIGPGPVADEMRRDKSQTRRAMRDLARRGYLAERNNGAGYAYFPAGGCGLVRPDAATQAVPNMRPGPPAGREPIDDAVFHEVPALASASPNSILRPTTSPSNSRALVRAEQAYDSRTACAVRQIARAKALADRRDALQGPRIGGPFFTAVNQLFELDP